MTEARDVIASVILNNADSNEVLLDTPRGIADEIVARLAAAGLSITATPDCGHPNHGSADHDCKPFTATPEGFPVSSVAVARVAQQIIGQEPSMVSSVWASNLLVELLEGRADV